MDPPSVGGKGMKNPYMALSLKGEALGGVMAEGAYLSLSIIRGEKEK